MKFFIGHHPVSVSSLLCRELNFGQHVERGAIYTYRLVISLSELRWLLEEVYDEFIEECRQDDERYGTDLDILGLSKLGYPTLEVVINNHTSLLEDIIQQYLYSDLFNIIFKGNKVETCQYVINSIQRVVISADSVVIQGDVFPMPKSPFEKESLS